MTGEEPTILLIEDDASIRESLEDMLAEEGFRVETAANGLEGLDRLAHVATPCLVLLDLMMPVMDGSQFLAVLRARRDLARPPIVVMTAAGERPLPGVSARLSKPLDFDQLLQTIRRCCTLSPQPAGA